MHSRMAAHGNDVLCARVFMTASLLVLSVWTTAAQVVPSISGNPCLSSGILFADDFSSPSTASQRWSKNDGAVGTQCGPLGDGNAAWFDGSGSTREMISVPLDLTKATTMSFQFGKGTCRSISSSSTYSIRVEYSVGDAGTYTLITSFTTGTVTSRDNTLSLPTLARAANVRIRLRQPRFASSGYAWGVDNIVIFYAATDGFGDSFSSSIFSSCNWFFPTGATFKQACGATSSVMDLGTSSAVGARVLGTRMMQTSCSDPACGTTLMFDMRLACSSAPSAAELAATIQVIVYYGSSRTTTYKAADYTVWRHVGITLPSSASLRVVFKQTSGTLSSTHWAIDNFYQGPGCKTFCTGHGHCSNSGTCVCDSGFSGSDCSSVKPGVLPTSLTEDFESGFPASRWLVSSGVTADTTCGPIVDGNAARFGTGTKRVLETNDMYLSAGSIASWYFMNAPTPCRPPTSSTYQVYFEYSVNGGQSWTRITTMYYYSYRTSASQLNYAIPAGAQDKTARFRWRNSATGTAYSVALIDNVYIGNPVNVSTSPLLETFDTTASGLIASTSHGTQATYCSSSGKTLLMQQSTGVKYYATSALSLKPVALPSTGDSMVQFDLYMGVCSSTQVTTTLSYMRIGISTLPSTSLSTLRAFVSQDYGNFWHRVSVVLPGGTYGGKTVFLSLYQTNGDSTTAGRQISIDNLYVGASCPKQCSGHGTCQTSVTCKCDTGYSGLDCSNVTTTTNPTYLKETFDGASLSSLWQPPVAMTVTSSLCGSSISSGAYIAATQRSYVRKLETVDMDLSNAAPYVNFRYLNGYGSFSGQSSQCRIMSSSSYQVRVQYSIDGGNTWSTMTNLYYYNYRSATDVTVILPVAGRSKATRIRWYQGSTSLTSALSFSATYQSWSVDNIVIGSQAGAVSGNGTAFSETFQSFTGGQWRSIANGAAKSYCSSASTSLVFDSSGVASSQGAQRYAATEIVPVQLQPVITPTEMFNTLPAGWQVTGGVLSKSCGLSTSGLIFNGPGPRNVVSRSYDTRSTSTLRFQMTQGGNGCDGSDTYDESVSVFYSVSGAVPVLLHTYPYNASAALTARTIFQTLPTAARAASVRFTWYQKSNSGPNLDLWGIDNVLLEQILSGTTQYFMQFDFISSCPSSTAVSSTTNYPIVVEYANMTAFSSSPVWKSVQPACNQQSRPAGCVANQYTSGSTFTSITHGWRRVTMPLSPTYAVSKRMQFRWRQQSFIASTPTWAIDNVYIGAECPAMCMGHGRCIAAKCQCDPGFGGSTCTPTAQLRTELKEAFDSGFDAKKWLYWSGNSSISSGRCGPLQGKYSLLFSNAGVREAVTVDMDTSDAVHVEFVLRMGQYSGSTCDRPDNSGETVVVQYSDNGGAVWVNLWTTTCTTCWNKAPTESIVTVLPSAAKTKATRFRWWQPQNGGTAQDEWRVGNIFIGGKSSNEVLLYDTFDPSVSDGNWLFHPNGILKTGECYRNTSQKNSLVFSESNGARLLYTRDLNVTKDTFIQFDFMTSCLGPFVSHSFDIRLQYSTNHGQTWIDVGPACTSSSTTSCVTGPVQTSYLLAGEFDIWRSVTTNLPSAAVTKSTRFRWYQALTTGNTWAIDNVFVGSGCANYCSGHGKCQPSLSSSSTGTTYCACDDGYSGADCSNSNVPTPTTFAEEFDNDPKKAKWSRIIGYTLGAGCGTLSQGYAANFDKGGLRTAETQDINTTAIDEIRFSIVVGSTSTTSTTCRKSIYTGNSVLFQYSNDASITWVTMATYSQNTYTARTVTVAIPSAAKTPRTRVRWIQPYNQGANLNQWAIDGISVRSVPSFSGFTEDFTSSSSYANTFSTPVAGVVSAAGYCNRKPAVYFAQGRANSIRSARLNLGKYKGSATPAVVQFWLNMGCGVSFGTSISYNVKFYYQIGNGASNYVIPQCGYACTGNKTYQSSMYWQAFQTWRRVTFILPDAVLVDGVYLSWNQSSASTSTKWAMTDVFIGQCKDACSGHGSCTSTGCKCDSGYSGATCTIATGNSKTFSDTFSSTTISTTRWPTVAGGYVGTACATNSGASLLFSGGYIRYAITEDLDLTTATRFTFYVRLGSTSSSTCEDPDQPEESVIFSFSTNGGVTWNNVRSFKDGSFTTGTLITVALTTAMKKTAVRFRWWQPANSGPTFDHWAIDTITILSPVPNPTSLAETFSSTSTSSFQRVTGRSTATTYCSRSGVWTFSGTTTLTTIRLDLAAGSSTVPTTLQFMYDLECGAATTSLLTLQGYKPTTNHIPLVPLCWNDRTKCPNQYIFPTTYMYTGGWQWVTIDLTKLSFGTSQVTFTWSRTGRWAIDNLFIGQCTNACSGHGQCLSTGGCSCWNGFTGASCQIAPALSTSFTESFSSTVGSIFAESVGGRIASVCGTVYSGSSLVFTGTGTRYAVTTDLDTRPSTTLSFYIAIGGSCETADGGQEDVALQYTNNGGVDWVSIQGVATGSKTARVSITIPAAAKTAATRFRWIQGSNSGSGFDGWAIDQVVLGANIKLPTQLVENFEVPSQSRQNLLFSSTAYTITGGVCGSRTGQSLNFVNQANQWVTTKDLDTRTATYIQFYLMISCGTTVQGANISLQYSTDLGATYQRVVDGCIVGQASCVGGSTNYQWSSDYFPGEFSNWKRVSVPLPASVRANGVRFRWQQSGATYSWSLDSVFVGVCAGGCTNGGACQANGTCKCDVFTVNSNTTVVMSGADCSKSNFTFPTTILDTYDSEATSGANWVSASGYTFGTRCGTLFSGGSASFDQDGPDRREATSVDIDTRTAEIMTFFFRIGGSGSCDGAEVNEDVLLLASLDYGMTWTYWKTLGYNQYPYNPLVPSQVQFAIPMKYRTDHIRFRFWQTQFTGANFDVWAVDNFYIGPGTAPLPTSLVDNFNTGVSTGWLWYPGGVRGSSCPGTQGSALDFAATLDGAFHFAETVPMNVNANDVVMFELSIGCTTSYSSTAGLNLLPVPLTMSTNASNYNLVNGLNCRSITPSSACPYESLPSTYYGYDNAFKTFQRISWQFTADQMNVRFRVGPTVLATTTQMPQFSIDNVYIGAPCPNHCSGHGTCTASPSPTCVCDSGYSGTDCNTAATARLQLISDDFESGALSAATWQLVQGGKIVSATTSASCGVISSGNNLYFSGAGLRQAVTVDMDTTAVDSSIMFYLRQGSSGRLTSCETSTLTSDYLLLQYSKNGGTTWTTLRVFTNDFLTPKQFNMTLPSGAKSVNTRFRLYQVGVQPNGQNQWAIDAVRIGPPMSQLTQIYDTFDPINGNYWSNLYGGTVAGFCSSTGRALTYLQRDLGTVFTTSQARTVVVSPSSPAAVQFSLAFSCTLTSSELALYNSVGSAAFVKLEYSNNGGLTWNMVSTTCKPKSYSYGVPQCPSGIINEPSAWFFLPNSGWKRFFVMVPSNQITSNTMFRWQSDLLPAQSSLTIKRLNMRYALDNVLISAACPFACRGHGTCQTNGKCVCDTGYNGTDCQPAGKLPDVIIDDFEVSATSSALWMETMGAVRTTVGCSTAPTPGVSGSRLHFGKIGLRRATTIDMDTTFATQITFSFVPSVGHCSLASKYSAVFVLYSSNGGHYYQSLMQIDNNLGTQTSGNLNITISIPSAARGNAVRFRWWQPDHNDTYDAFEIDNVNIGGVCNTVPCLNGGTCTESSLNAYTCQCTADYKGSRCEQHTNPCATNPCLNGATCNRNHGTASAYSCSCTGNFTGSQCQYFKNGCTLSPCKNNATCFDYNNLPTIFTSSCFGRCGQPSVGSICKCDASCELLGGCCTNYASTCSKPLLSMQFSCQCQAGYTGVQCDTLIDNCLAAPCGAHGNCTNAVNSYSCSCSAGYTGRACQTEINECQSSPCQNNATCQDGLNGYTCKCVTGWSGTRCHTNANDCLLRQCLNGATCIDGLATVTCVCPVGYTGTYCQLDVNECASRSGASSQPPCQNGAQCVNVFGSFLCKCPPGVTGERCQTALDLCSTVNGSYCLNGGVCMQAGATVACNCTAQFYGSRCQYQRNYCQTGPCLAGGVCVSLPTSYTCNCPAWRTGLRCETDLDECVSSPCLNNGTCIDRLNNYTCSCPPTSYGDRCENTINVCANRPCSNGGTCSIYNVTSFQCACPAEYTGLDCSLPADQCQPNPCANGATCSRGPGGMDYSCNCATGYNGTLCDVVIDYCAKHVCLNGATCTNHIGFAKCQCAPGWQGLNCELDINDCLPNPCYNGGTCIDGINNFTCNCTSAFTGSTCHTAIDLCVVAPPCQNGGTCLSLIGGRYQCLCTAEYGGSQCQTRRSPCLRSSCSPHSNCTWDGVSNGYQCACFPDYTGTYCTSQINNCKFDSCLNGGTCNDGINSFSCQCPLGYTGSSCETNVDDCVGNNCTNGATCLDLIAAHSCQCAPGYSGNRCQTNIDDCANVTCLNQGTCVDGIARYTCTCIHGFTGPQCQHIIDQCTPASCHNGGTCNPQLNSYTCTCASGYTGASCETNVNDCVPGVCANAGTCVDGLNSYTCLCAPGFTGVNCSTNIDDCVASNCSNGATCVDGVNTYSCFCAAGFTGQRCEVNINDCIGVVCHNGGQCFDLVNDYVCTCSLGFTGRHCQTNIDDCLTAVCRNGGSCVDGLGAYTCACPTAFTGRHCETQQDFCPLNKCQNGASCVTSNTSYTCTCPLGFTGTYCQSNIDDCVANNCQNGASCVDGIASYSCLCFPGYTGQMCQTNIDDCLGNNCMNNATCVDALQSYSCMCVAGFTGTHCQTNINDCATAPCAQGATCVDGVDRYTCVCPLGFTGTTCQTNIDDCVGNTCQNNASCVDGIATYSCACVAGFTGQRCQTNVDECSVEPCVNGGTCQDGINTYSCVCSPGYTGPTCAAVIHTCTITSCLNGATCVEATASFTCQCAAGWTGASCETNIDNCVNSTCRNGARCVDGLGSYTCACLAGFTGKMCETNINDCVANQCQNNASCVDGVNTYTCNCVAGFTGPMCQTNVDDCVAHPCRNSGTCVDGVNMYTCNCAAGYTGPRCGTVAHTCTASSCFNGATCVNGLNTFTCQCAAGFTGAACQTNVNDCTATSCSNGATCVDGINSFTCNCAAGFTGTTCQTNIDDCPGNQCQNGATCMDAVDSYTCSCVAGFTGQMCQSNIDDCAASPCKNAGSCVDGINMYTCTCAAGFTGTMCQTNINDCATAPCQNSGTCQDGVNTYTCVCAAGFTGPMCQTNIDDCATNPCQNSATCVDGIDAYTCSCVAGFTGRMCQTNVDNCVAAPCQNGGTCMDLVNTYSCVCASGYTGPNCENVANTCTATSCRNGGTCVGGLNTFTCTCASGFTGTACQTNVNDCTATSCSNGATCIDGINSFTCNCAAGFTGTTCKTNIDNCPGNQCQNGATCMDAVDSYTCSCVAGFTGQMCQSNIDDCAASPCKNAGSCVDGINTYTCTCAAGFTGTMCQTNINDCATAPCQNSGTCQDGINSYTCMCAAGFTGQNCQTNVDDCAGVTCSNGGLCVDGIDMYTCNCAPGFTGATCQTNPDDCSGVTCMNGGSCVDGLNAYTCSCAPGFTGKMCETNIDDCAAATCWNDGSCVDGLNTYTCSCVLGFTGKNCETNINDCAGVTCLNGGSCLDGVNSHTCTCVAGFTDAQCQTNINNCVTGACMNGGTCVDGITVYSCTCPSGFTGTRCETNVDDCVGVSCQNGGSCVDGVNSYNCSCAAGFTGKMCQTNIDDCAGVTCQNGGVCVDGISAFTCSCAAGFTGRTCQSNVDDCAGAPCLNAGTCVDGVDTYTCTCPMGFSGRWCQTNIDDCVGTPCQNGQCVDGVNDFTCMCNAGFTGRTCQTSINHCQGHKCMNFAPCVNAQTGYTCSCTTGFTGHLCQSRVDYCAAGPCANGATCVSSHTGYTCQCATGFTGAQCQVDIFCSPKPCRNGGTCTNGRCACATGWTGATCTSASGSATCATLCCANGGTCHETVNGNLCTCTPGWGGVRCVQATCDNQDCHRRGQCYLTASNLTAACKCETGYAGSTCQNIVPVVTAATAGPCAAVDCGGNGRCADGVCVCNAGWSGAKCANPIGATCATLRCANTATCHETTQGFVCQCAPGWTGTRCIVGTCANQDCNGRGRCTLLEGNTSSKCVCNEGYSGDSCQISGEGGNAEGNTGSSSSVPIWVIIVAVVGGILVLVIIIAVVILRSRRHKVYIVPNSDSTSQMHYTNPLYDTYQRGENLEQALSDKRAAAAGTGPSAAAAQGKLGVMDMDGEEGYEQMGPSDPTDIGYEDMDGTEGLIN